MKTALSKADRALYRKAKAAIKKGLEGVVANYRLVGVELKAIHDAQWWREDHDTWDAFCAEELPFGRKRAEQLIRAVDTTVSNERQARELLGLEPAEQEAVRRLLQSAGEPTTAELIRNARAELEEETKGLEGKEKSQAIAKLVNEAEEKGRKAGQEKPSRVEAIGQVLKKVGGLLAYCAKQHAGLVDVADVADQKLARVRLAIADYEEAVKASAEEELRAA